MSEVTALPAGDIQHGSGISVGGEAAQPAYQQPAPAASFTEAQTAASTAVADLYRQAADPSTSRDQREILTGKIRDLNNHIFKGTAAPAWYGEQKPDPRLTDQRPYDSMSAEMEAASQPMTEAQQAQLTSHAKVKGLNPTQASEAVQFCVAAKLDPVTAKVVATRIASHIQNGGGTGELSQQEASDLYERAAKLLGGYEKFAEVNSLARQYVQSVGLAEFADRSGTLKFDPSILLMLSHKARMAGFKAKAA